MNVFVVPPGHTVRSVTRPIEFEGIHILDGCGCPPHEVYKQHVMNVVNQDGKAVSALVAVIRLCLN